MCSSPRPVLEIRTNHRSKGPADFQMHWTDQNESGDVRESGHLQIMGRELGTGTDPLADQALDDSTRYFGSICTAGANDTWFLCTWSRRHFRSFSIARSYSRQKVVNVACALRKIAFSCT